MLNRITTGAAARQMNGNLQNSLRGLTQIQNELTTGRRINRMSDGPAEATTSLAQRAQLRQTEQYARNADRSQMWLRSGDVALGAASDQLANARNLVIQARSGATDPASRAAIADQLRQVRESLLATANSQTGGRPIFGGTTAGAVAYDSAGVYQGDAGIVNLQVAPNQSTAVNVTGTTVFGTPNTTTPLNGDVFQLLDALATAVAANDQASLANSTGLIDAATARVAQAQVVIGSRSAQMEETQQQNVDATIAFKSSISRLEDVDMAEALISLRSKEAAYQAALQVTARVIQPSLLDFLR